MTRERQTSYINSYTRGFLLRAIKEGSHLNPPSGMSVQDWVELRNVAGSFLSSPARSSDIGRIYGDSGIGGGDRKPLMGNTIRARVHRFLDTVYANSSPELQKSYQRKRLSLNKKGSTYYRLKISAKMGGVANQVAEQLAQGRHARTVLRNHNLETQDKAYVRSRIREMGVDLPLRGGRTALELENAERPLRQANAPDASVQKALDKLSMAQFKGLAAEDPPLVTTAIKLAQELGYSFSVASSVNAFVDVLTSARIPVSIKEIIVKSGNQAGVKRRYVLWTGHKERVKQAYEDTPQLDAYKSRQVVEKVCGPDLKLPPPHIINKYRTRLGFIPVTKALRQVGFSKKWNKEQLVAFFGTDSPITVIRVYDTLYCHHTQLEQLKQFVDNKGG